MANGVFVGDLALLARQKGREEGKYDILREPIDPVIEHRAQRVWCSLDFVTHQKEFVEGYLEGRALFDQSYKSQVAVPAKRSFNVLH